MIGEVRGEERGPEGGFIGQAAEAAGGDGKAAEILEGEVAASDAELHDHPP